MSGGRQLLQLDVHRMIPSGESRPFTPDVAVALFWRPLLVLRRMMESRALHGLLTALLHHHGLVQVSGSLFHHRLLPFAASVLHHDLVLLVAAPQLLRLVHLCGSLYLHSLVLIIV